MFFKRITSRVVSATALLGFGVLVLMFFPSVVRSLLYFPSHNDQSAAGGDGFAPFRSAGGEFLGYIRKADRADYTAVVFHGNGGEALHRSWYFLPLQNARVHLVLADYPGYGARPGSPSEESILRSADLVVTEAGKIGLPLIIIGESLGSGAACYVASKHSIRRLALISPFTSIVDVAQFHYGWIAARALIPDRYESTSYLPAYAGPLHIIHGTEDQVVPISLGKKLFTFYSGKAGEFTEVPGYHHNDMAEAIVDSDRAARFRAFIRGEPVQARSQ